MLLLRFNLFQIFIFSSILSVEAVAEGEQFPIAYRQQSFTKYLRLALQSWP